MDEEDLSSLARGKFRSGPQFNWVLVVIVATAVILMLIGIIALFWHVIGSGGATQNLPTSSG